MGGGGPLASDAVPSEAILGFGLLKTYSTDQPVILRADGNPYYDNVKKLVGVDMALAAKIKSGYTGALPYGTLTDSSAGRYVLSPNTPSGNYALYDVDGVDSITETFAGQKVMWNVYTSPDVIVGAVQVPEDISVYSMDVTSDTVVPYVKINHESNGSDTLVRVDLYFIKRGDDTTYTPVALGTTSVKVYINGSSESGTYDNCYEFTNFNKAVRNSFNLNMYEEDFSSMTVEYIKDGAKYIWNFVPNYQDTAYDIDFGYLDLSEQPFTLKAGESKDIEITIPGRYDLSSYSASDFVSVGNVEVLSVDSVSFTQGTAAWDVTTWDESDSILSFTLTGLAMGRTAIRINLPDVGTYIREVHVTSGDEFTLSGTTPSGVSMSITEHATRATFVNGKPWYPSAVDNGYTYSFILSGSDLPDSGYFGMTKDTISELHIMSVDKESSSSKTYSIQAGIYYDTDDSEHNGEDYPLAIDDDAIETATVWAEFPDNSSFNVVSASLKSIVVASNYMTTAEQLETLAPYFELYNLDKTYYTVSMDWSFVNPKTMAQVTEGISNVKIDGDSVDGTSGTINTFYGNFIFQYDYNGITYTWEFDVMPEEEEYGSIPELSLKPGESTDVEVSLGSNYESLDSIDINIWDNSILSADPMSFTITTSTISFKALALKAGTTRIALVFTLKDVDSSYDRYVQTYTDITVAGSSSGLTSTDLTASFYPVDGLGYGTIAEGKTISYTFNDASSVMRVELSRKGTVSEDYYNNYIAGKAWGTLSFYNGDTETFSRDITFDYDYITSTLKLVCNGDDELIAPGSVTKIVWTAFSDLFTNGSADVPTSLTSPESFNNTKPHIKLNRDGLNVSTLEYYFVDNEDNKISTPAEVSALSVRVDPTNGTNFYNEDESGTMAVNLPEKAISTIYFNFTSGDVTYDSTFTFAADDEDTEVAGVTWRDANDNIVDKVVPLFMTVGESRDFSLSNTNNAQFENSTFYVGNSAIVSVDKLAAEKDSMQLRLTALAAGMTSLTITYEASGTSYVSNPFEIWVADADGTIPNLSGTSSDIYALLTSDDLTSGSSGGWNGSNSDSGESGNSNSEFATTDPVTVLSGLSVNPRYALPTDPSGDLYSNMWDKVYDENLSYGAFMFEDDVEVVASRDVTEVFNKVSADLIAKDTPQILAIVLPEITVSADGIYTFRIPTDNITAAGTQIFMYANDSDETPTEMNYYPDSGDELAEISGEDYINVAVYLTVGTYTPIFTAAATTSDVYIINGALSPALTLTASTLTVSMDISADSRVTLTPGNVVGTVTYSANQSWITFSGNVATFRPTVAGTYSVIITVTDSSLRTATVTIAVTVTESSTASGDVRPTSPDVPVSPDVRPTSPDQPAPVSPDISPVSPDQPAPTSPDQPAPVSPDEPAPTSPDQPAPTPSDNTSGDNTPKTVAIIESTSLNLNDAKTVANIQSFFAQRSIPSNTPVVSLFKENATIGGERSIADVSDEERAQIAEDETVAKVFPIIRVNRPAIYAFAATVSNVRAGLQMSLYMMPQRDTTNAAEFTAAEDTDTEDAYMFLNDDGEEITTVPENKHINIAAYMEPDYTYGPILTVKESSSEGGDTPGSDTPGSDTPGSDTPGSDTPAAGSAGSSGGGCDSGFSFMALAVLGLLAKLTKKRLVK